MVSLRSTRAVLLLALQCAAPSSGQNIAATRDGVAIATTSDGVSSLTTYDTSTSARNSHRFSPAGVGGFDDVAVDPASNARGNGGATAFAIDAGSGVVCSFKLWAPRRRNARRRNARRRNGNRMNGGASLRLINCTTRSVGSRPFVGISAMGGTLVVSGGTRGVSVFRYDADSGEIDSSPAARNVQLGDVGHPDVAMVTPNLAALSTDLARGFGVVIATVNQGSDRESRGRVTRDRVFRVRDTVGFEYALSPANFPLTSAVYRYLDTRYLYVANGPITVQDPTRNGSSSVVADVPRGFQALTVDVNAEEHVAVFGGMMDDGSRTAYIVLDISDPLNPELVDTKVVGDVGSRRRGGRGAGRITGIASSGQSVLYVREGSSDVAVDTLKNSTVVEEADGLELEEGGFVKVFE